MAGAQLPKGGWKPPDVAAAITNSHSIHPRTVDEFKEEVPWSVCGTNAGRFCCGAMDWMCCDRKAASELAAMGPGVSSYFKLVKALTWLFCIWTFFSIPIIVLVTFGTRSTNLADTTVFAEVTLGQLGDDLNVTLLDVIGTDCSPEGDGSTPCVLTKLAAAEVFTYCDLLAVGIFCLAYVWIRIMDKREQAVVDSEHITVQDYTAYLTSVPPHTKREHILAHFAQLVGPEAVADVQVAEDDAQLLRIFVRRGRQIKKLTDLTEQLAKAMYDENPRLEGWLLRRRDQIKDKIRVMNREAAAIKANNRALGAFVTFEKYSDFAAIIKGYKRGGYCGFLCQPMRMRMILPDPSKSGRSKLAAAAGKAAAASGTPSAAASGAATPVPAGPEMSIRLRIKPAPPPSTVMWHNLHIRWWSRMRRRSVTGAISLVMLAVSIGAGIFASIQQNNVGTTTPGACPSGTLAELEVLAREADATKESIDCFCSLLSQTNQLAVATEALCTTWLQDVAIATASTVFAAAIVPLTNGLFKILLKKMSEWESHHSLNSQAESFAQRLFFLTVINTAVLPVLINARIPGLDIGGNRYADFTPEWYATVGVQITLTMVINIFVPHLTPIFRFAYVSAVRRGWCVDHLWGIFAVGCFGPPQQRAASQRQLNSWFEGPKFMLDTRYATIMQTVVVTLVFGTLLPLLVPIAFFNMLVSFYIDKWLLLRFYRTPPHYDVHLGRTLTSWIPLALFVHFAVAAYAMSTPQIFASTTIDVFNAGNAGVPEPFRSLANRLQQSHVLPLIIAAAVVLAFIIVTNVLSGTTRAATAAFKFLTCGLCDNSDEEEDANGQLCTRTTFTEAKNASMIDGLLSYNLMQNPDIAKAIAIAPSVAAHKKRLIDIKDDIGAGDEEPPLSPGASAVTNPVAAAVAAATFAAADGGDEKHKPVSQRPDASVHSFSGAGLSGSIRTIVSSRPVRPSIAIPHGDVTSRAASFGGAVPAPPPLSHLGHVHGGDESDDDDDYEEPVYTHDEAGYPTTAYPAQGGSFVGGRPSSGMVVTPRTQVRTDRDDAYRKMRGAALGSGFGDDWTNAVPGRRQRQEAAERDARAAMSLGRDVSARMLSAWRAGEDRAFQQATMVAGSDDDEDGDGMVAYQGGGIHHTGSGMLVSPAAPRMAPRGPAMEADDDSDEDDSDGEVHFTGPGGIMQPHGDADYGEHRF